MMGLGGEDDHCFLSHVIAEERHRAAVMSVWSPAGVLWRVICLPIRSCFARIFASHPLVAKYHQSLLHSVVP